MIDQIDSVIRGQTRPNFARHSKWFGSSSTISFSIIYGDNKSLDLCAQSKSVCHTWYNTLVALVNKIKEDRQNVDLDKKYLRLMWNIADCDNSGDMTKKELVNMISSLRMHRQIDAITKCFDSVNKANKFTINFDEFMNVMELLRRRLVIISYIR